ncbi:MAG: trigger factor [Ruminococcaceae bacterium]|nr:trigger factor [Oscillospiraceae bacterium]
MAVKSEQVEKNLVKLTFEVSASDFAEAMNKAYAKNAKKYNVPGFRKGKVPRSIIEKYYTEAVFYDDAINFVLPEAYENALNESGIEPAARPEIDVDEIKKGEAVKFTALVTTKPEVALGEYIGIKVNKIEHNVTEADIDNDIKATQEKNVRLVPVEDRSIQNGDIVTIDFDGSVDGVHFDGGKAEGYELEIGSNTFIPGFEDQLVGKNAGDDVDVNVTFPEEYHAPDLAGKKALFEVKIHDVKAKEYPELNDDFASEVSEFETMAEFRASVKERLEKMAEQKVKTETENAVIDKVCENAEVEIPEAMINEEVDKMINDFAQRLQYQGLDINTYMQYTGNTMEGFKETFKPQAEKRIKTTLVLEAIVKAEGIAVTDEEVNDRICEMAKQYNMEADKLKELMQERDIDNLKSEIAMTNAIDMLVNKAKISKPRGRKPKAESAE